MCSHSCVAFKFSRPGWQLENKANVYNYLLTFYNRIWSAHQQAAPPTLENHKRISYSHVCLQIDTLSLEHRHIFPHKEISPVTCTSQFVSWQWGWVENVPEVAVGNVPDVSSQTVAHAQNALTWNALVGLEQKRKHVGAESAQVSVQHMPQQLSTHKTLQQQYQSSLLLHMDLVRMCYKVSLYLHTYNTSEMYLHVHIPFDSRHTL